MVGTGTADVFDAAAVAADVAAAIVVGGAE